MKRIKRTSFPRFKRRPPFQGQRIRRTTHNEGYFIPSESDYNNVIGWIRKESIKAAAKVGAIDSPLASADSFHDEGVLAFSKCLTKYQGFTSPQEFWSLTMRSVKNRFLDLNRRIFAKKRWGFTVTLSEESDDDSLSTAQSLSHSSGMLEALSHSHSDEIEFRDLVQSLRSLLSDEARPVLDGLISGDVNLRTVDRHLLNEIQSSVNSILAA